MSKNSIEHARNVCAGLGMCLDDIEGICFLAMVVPVKDGKVAGNPMAVSNTSMELMFGAFQRLIEEYKKDPHRNVTMDVSTKRFDS